MKDHIKLTFATDEGKSITVNVSNPRLTLNDGAVATIANNLVSLGVIKTSAGKAERCSTASLITYKNVVTPMS